MKTVYSFLLTVLWLCSASKVKYDGYQVYRAYPTMLEHVSVLHSLENHPGFSFWTEADQFDKPVDVMVPSHLRYNFLEMMESNGIDVEILIEDVQDLITKNDVVKSFAANMTWDAYYELDAIRAWMQSLASDHPGVVQFISAGTSFEDRDIAGVKISYGGAPGKRAVFIEGGIHANEWITPATATYIINELLTSSDPTVRRIAESFEWHIFPVINPDGYVYSHNTDRLWRKNRKPGNSNCTGVDLNRNWNFYWGIHSTTNNSCSNNYGGVGAFSEKETANMAGYIRSLSRDLDVFMSFHSYSQYLLIPYGNVTTPLANYADLFAIGSKAVEALIAKHNTTYLCGNTAALMGNLYSGTTTDWVKDTLNVPITFAYELRDKGKFGFLLPPDQILPNNEEVMESLVTIFIEAANLGYFPQSDRQYILNQ